MKPARLLALLGGLFAALALSGYTSGGTTPSYVTKMVFQKGVSPTSDYAGFTDTYIRPGTASADTGKNYGGSDSLKIAGPSAASGEMRTLIGFDISALPDSAIIVKAQLMLYQGAPNATLALVPASGHSFLFQDPAAVAAMSAAALLLTATRQPWYLGLFVSASGGVWTPRRSGARERAERGGGHDHVGEQAEPGGRNVDVHDAHGLALLVVGRRHEEHQIKPVADQSGCQRKQPGQHHARQLHEARRIGQTLGERLHGMRLSL